MEQEQEQEKPQEEPKKEKRKPKRNAKGQWLPGEVTNPEGRRKGTKTKKKVYEELFQTVLRAIAMYGGENNDDVAKGLYAWLKQDKKNLNMELLLNLALPALIEKLTESRDLKEKTKLEQQEGMKGNVVNILTGGLPMGPKVIDSELVEPPQLESDEDEGEEGDWDDDF